MVEFDQNHRTVDPVVEDAVLLRLANPRKIGAFEMLAHLVQLDLSVSGPHVAHVFFDPREQQLLLVLIFNRAWHMR